MKSIFSVYKNPKMFLILLLGFTSGLPLAMTGSTLQAWLKDAQIDITTIGIFSLVGLPYTVKFLWSPLMDSVQPPFWGRRRGWAALSLIGLIASEIFLAVLDPASSLYIVGVVAFLVAFFSASQDIVVDALRTETLDKDEYGAGAGTYTTGYRLAMLISGAVALSMADHLPWRTVYFFLAAVQTIGLIAIYFAKEPPAPVQNGQTFRERVLDPFLDFFRKFGAWEILAFVMLYKLSTMMATSLTTAFLMDLTFTKTEIGMVSKTVGLVSTIVGVLAGGAIMTKIGLKRSLWIFGILQTLGVVSFIVLALVGHDYTAMVVAIGAENFMIGLGVAAIQGFIMTVCSLQFTATQFALLSSLTAVTRVIFSSQAGRIVEATGWVNFYIFSMTLAIPGLLLLTQFSKWSTVETGSLRKVTSTDMYCIVFFLAGLIMICTDAIWHSMGLKTLGATISTAGAALSSISLLTGIFAARKKTV